MAMRVLIAPDKFKGSLDAFGVAESITRGIREVMPEVEIDFCPLADGGEGTAEIIHRNLGGIWEHCAAHDAIGREIDSRYLWLKETAIIEVSETIGLRRLTWRERDPIRATSYGVGEVMVAARKRGARELVIGLGGSATNDGGFGMARALGFRFYAGARELTSEPGELSQLTRIDGPKQGSAGGRILVAADVRNPLLGRRGATHVFAAQKGANSGAQIRLETALTRFADVVAAHFGRDFRDRAGAGAAGGLGFGLLSFGGAELRPGFDVIAEVLKLPERIKRADFVVTGEGRLDRQTLEGKAPAGVARLARSLGKRVYAIAGEVATDAGEALALFDEVKILAQPPYSRTAAIKLCAELIRERAMELGSGLVSKPTLARRTV